jgi:hypothetical protein
MYIRQPKFPLAFRQFLYAQRHLDSDTVPENIDDCPYFEGKIKVFHSAVARFYAPSDLCGAGWMYRERIRSNPNWYDDCARYDTVFVVVDELQPGMRGMVVARVLLFFSFTDPYLGKDMPCALVNWFVHAGEEPDEDTGMWVVEPELEP